MKYTILLILIAGLLAFVTDESRSASDSDQNDKDVSYLLDCGYIRRNFTNTIFNPNFVLFLSKQQKKYSILSKIDVENAIHIWNSKVTAKRKIIRYQHEHFIKMAMLSTTLNACDNDCMLNGESLAILRYWMSDVVIDVKRSAAMRNITPVELKYFNIDNDNNIDKALKEIMKNPVAKQLLAYAIDNKITIRSNHLQNLKGYFDCRHRTIVIDPTVSSYIFKINCIIHELVHASNFDNDNSIIEETIAEIIGMTVQDNITDIDISCSPYIVFIDRVLDADYGKHPVSNNIYKHLKRAGVVVHIANGESE